MFFVFALAPPKGRGAQRSAAKKQHFAHPGPTAKNFLETNDAGHEQKGATTKKNNTLAGFVGVIGYIGSIGIIGLIGFIRTIGFGV